tara:strand:- start:62 stop:238 length:177 start_codon:yes stop_codon:yes gene_type:complete
MRKILDTINHAKATPEKIQQMKDNGWSDQEIAEKFAYMEKINLEIDNIVSNNQKKLIN